MRALEVHPGRGQVLEISLDNRLGDPVSTVNEAERGLKAALGGAFRYDLEPIPGLEDHVLVVDRVDRYGSSGPAFYLRSDPRCLINGIGIVLGKDGAGGFSAARATARQLMDLVCFVKPVDRPLSSPVPRA